MTSLVFRATRPPITTAGIIFLLLLAISMLIGCQPKARHYTLSGPTMGTTYHITLVSTQEPSPDLSDRIEQRLQGIDRQMSTYREDSEISRFNSPEQNDWFAISEDFARVMQQSIELSALTQGAFDPTVKQLVELWGFGASAESHHIPTTSEIETLLTHTGMDKLQLQDNRLHKSDPAVQIDLSAIAKGYAVDAITDVIADCGYSSYLVEIGGEVRAGGRRHDGTAWKIAVQQPDGNSESINRIIPLDHQSVATSGDYRNFFERDGKRYSHVIDPATGYPPDNTIASVTVISDMCTRADALATALMVMPLQQGLEFAREQGLPVYFILRHGRKFETRYSPAFQKLLETST
jgi:thiamine biosynthesis lipoprotein